MRCPRAAARSPDAAVLPPRRPPTSRGAMMTACYRPPGKPSPPWPGHRRTASRSARVAKTWRASPPPVSPCVAAADRPPGRSRSRRAGAAVHHAARGTAYTRAMTTLLSRTGAWRMAFPACALALCTALALPASAQRYELDLSQLDPAAVMSLGDEVLLRAPDP